MNIRKDIDYSAMFAAMDTIVDTGAQQMELYCALGRLVCQRPEKGAAVAAAEYLKEKRPDVPGFSPRNLRRMRDFYRMYKASPELRKLAMDIGWTQNVVILEADLSLEERRWYLLAVRKFGWSKAELQRQIDSAAHQKYLTPKQSTTVEISRSTSSIEQVSRSMASIDTLFCLPIKEKCRINICQIFFSQGKMKKLAQKNVHKLTILLAKYKKRWYTVIGVGNISYIPCKFLFLS